jgi:hypothetical protein
MLDVVLGRYFRAAERWHWRPSEVDGESALHLAALLDIAAVVDEIRDEQQKKEQRKADAGANKR